ncbi:hypothetical protein LEP1GSC007_4007 [Leptospira interrogans serovar Bulgarica str. Mallika]|nr:hypothetical protein LEP1GSC007_4007 [Leptospira interrogans serovar Bulgarica str. Mallika]
MIVSVPFLFKKLSDRVSDFFEFDQMEEILGPEGRINFWLF